MDQFDLLALLGAAAAGGYVATLLAGAVPARPAPLIAALAAGFGAFTLLCMTTGGPIGFWSEHTDSLWGVQVWFDLILAIGIALTVLVPMGRAAGMRVLPWVLLTLCTGSIGLLAMAARLIWLRTRAARPSPTPS